MARDQYSDAISSADDWEQINSGAVTGNFTLQMLRGDAMIRFTTDTTKPTEENGLHLWEGWTEIDVTVEQFTKTANMQHIWLKRIAGKPVTYYIDHA